MTDKTNARRPLLTAEEWAAVEGALRDESKRLFEVDGNGEASEVVETAIAKLRSGAQPPVGLTSEDIGKLLHELSVLWEHADHMGDMPRRAMLEDLQDRLRSLHTSTDRVLATYHSGEVQTTADFTDDDPEPGWYWVRFNPSPGMESDEWGAWHCVEVRIGYQGYEPCFIERDEVHYFHKLDDPERYQWGPVIPEPIHVTPTTEGESGE